MASRESPTATMTSSGGGSRHSRFRSTRPIASSSFRAGISIDTESRGGERGDESEERSVALAASLLLRSRVGGVGGDARPAAARARTKARAGTRSSAASAATARVVVAVVVVVVASSSASAAAAAGAASASASASARAAGPGAGAPPRRRGGRGGRRVGGEARGGGGTARDETCRRGVGRGGRRATRERAGARGGARDGHAAARHRDGVAREGVSGAREGEGGGGGGTMTRRAPRRTTKEIGEDLMKSRIVIVTTETLRRPFLRLENVAVAVCAPGPPRNVRGAFAASETRAALTARARLRAPQHTRGPAARNSSGAMFVEVCIEGFKSYAQRTVVPSFDPLFNAITGLNGSGKSNILDSICFVLGITNLSQASTRGRARAIPIARLYRADAAARRRGGGGPARPRLPLGADGAPGPRSARFFVLPPIIPASDSVRRPSSPGTLPKPTSSVLPSSARGPLTSPPLAPVPLTR